MGCALSLLKILMFVFNFVCAVVGLVLLIVGAVGIHKLGYFKKFLPSTLGFIPKITLIFGIIVFAISFLGCCGVYRKSKCKLILYAIILLLLFVVQFFISIYGMVIITKSGKQLPQKIKNELLNITKNYDDLPNVERECVDIIQQQLECCGVSVASDYTNDLPSSCCKADVIDCDRKSCYPDGCLVKINRVIREMLRTVVYASFGICGVELLVALIAIYLVFAFKKEVPVVQEVPPE